MFPSGSRLCVTSDSIGSHDPEGLGGEIPQRSWRRHNIVQHRIGGPFAQIDNSDPLWESDHPV